MREQLEQRTVAVQPARAAAPAPGKGPAPEGSPLDAGIRGAAERALGVDFTGVRVLPLDPHEHPDTRAMAYDDTIHVAPGAEDDRELFAHELTHLAQQRRVGPASATGELEDEADRFAPDVARGQPVALRGNAPRGTPLFQRVKRGAGKDKVIGTYEIWASDEGPNASNPSLAWIPLRMDEGMQLYAVVAAPPVMTPTWANNVKELIDANEMATSMAALGKMQAAKLYLARVARLHGPLIAAMKPPQPAQLVAPAQPLPPSQPQASAKPRKKRNKKKPGAAKGPADVGADPQGPDVAPLVVHGPVDDDDDDEPPPLVSADDDAETPAPVPRHDDVEVPLFGPGPAPDDNDDDGQPPLRGPGMGPGPARKASPDRKHREDSESDEDEDEAPAQDRAPAQDAPWQQPGRARGRRRNAHEFRARALKPLRAPVVDRDGNPARYNGRPTIDLIGTSFEHMTRGKVQLIFVLLPDNYQKLPRDEQVGLFERPVRYAGKRFRLDQVDSDREGLAAGVEEGCALFSRFSPFFEASAYTRTALLNEACVAGTGRLHGTALADGTTFTLEPGRGNDPRVPLQVRDGWGFIRASVARAMGIDMPAVQPPGAKPGSLKRTANPNTQMLMWLDEHRDAAVELVDHGMRALAGGTKNKSDEELYRTATTGRFPLRTGTAMPSPTDRLILPASLGKTDQVAAIHRNPADKPNWTTTRTAQHGDPTAQFLDTMWGLQYRWSGRIAGDKNDVIMKGMVGILPDDRWPSAWSDSEVLVARSDRKVDSSWKSQEEADIAKGKKQDPTRDESQLTGGFLLDGDFNVNRIYPPGSFVGVPSAAMDEINGDYDGDSVHVLLADDSPALFGRIAHDQRKMENDKLTKHLHFPEQAESSSNPFAALEHADDGTGKARPPAPREITATERMVDAHGQLALVGVWSNIADILLTAHPDYRPDLAVKLGYPNEDALWQVVLYGIKAGTDLPKTTLSDPRFGADHQAAVKYLVDKGQELSKKLRRMRLKSPHGKAHLKDVATAVRQKQPVTEGVRDNQYGLIARVMRAIDALNSTQPRAISLDQRARPHPWHPDSVGNRALTEAHDSIDLARKRTPTSASALQVAMYDLIGAYSARLVDRHAAARWEVFALGRLSPRDVGAAWRARLAQGPDARGLADEWQRQVTAIAQLWSAFERQAKAPAPSPLGPPPGLGGSGRGRGRGRGRGNSSDEGEDPGPAPSLTLRRSHHGPPPSRGLGRGRRDLPEDAPGPSTGPALQRSQQSLSLSLSLSLSSSSSKREKEREKGREDSEDERDDEEEEAPGLSLPMSRSLHLPPPGLGRGFGSRGNLPPPPGFRPSPSSKSKQERDDPSDSEGSWSSTTFGRSSQHVPPPGFGFRPSPSSKSKQERDDPSDSEGSWSSTTFGRSSQHVPPPGFGFRPSSSSKYEEQDEDAYGDPDLAEAMWRSLQPPPPQHGMELGPGLSRSRLAKPESKRGEPGDDGGHGMSFRLGPSPMLPPPGFGPQGPSPLAQYRRSYGEPDDGREDPELAQAMWQSLHPLPPQHGMGMGMGFGSSPSRGARGDREGRRLPPPPGLGFDDSDDGHEDPGLAQAMWQSLQPPQPQHGMELGSGASPSRPGDAHEAREIQIAMLQSLQQQPRQPPRPRRDDRVPPQVLSVVASAPPPNNETPEDEQAD